MTEELTVYQGNNLIEFEPENAIFFDVAKFEHAWRVASMLAKSTMVPEHFQNNPGNCMIALNFADRVGLDPVMIMQKMYVIHNKPGIEAQLMIALINRSGKFTPLKFKLDGSGKDLKCTCYATEKATGEVCSQTVTLEMVTAEGWDKKPGSKWKTMPELMAQYRSAAFFGRLYCPEAIMGMMTKEELHDIEQPAPATSLAGRLKPVKEISAPNSQGDHNKDESVANPLHATPDWSKYKEACDIFPDIAKTLPEPTTIEQCKQAVNQINKTIDARNA